MTPKPNHVKTTAARNDRPPMHELLRDLDDETIGRFVTEATIAVTDPEFDPTNESQWFEFTDQLGIDEYRADVACKIAYNLYLGTRVALEDHYERELEREEYRQRWSERYGSKTKHEHEH